MNQHLNVYILTYNRADYLRQCIQSVLNQTYENFELYVLDNHSSDNTSLVVSGIDDSRLHYICHEENIGGFGNLIYATQHCEADFFVMFHDDDIMLPDFLKREIEVMEKNTDVVLVSSNAESINSAGEKTGDCLKVIDSPRVYKEEELFKSYLYDGNVLIFPSIMYRKSFLAEHNILPDEKVGPAGDVVFYCDVGRYGGVTYELPDILMQYRLHSGQDTNLSRDMMHVQLFDYMRSDAYYSKLLESNVAGQHRTFKRFVGDEIAYFIQSKGNVQNFWDIIIAYKNCLKYNKKDWRKYWGMIQVARRFPNLTNKIYLLYKRMKKRPKS